MYGRRPAPRLTLAVTWKYAPPNRIVNGYFHAGLGRHAAIFMSQVLSPGVTSSGTNGNSGSMRLRSTRRMR